MGMLRVTALALIEPYADRPRAITLPTRPRMEGMAAGDRQRRVNILEMSRHG